MTVQAAGEGRGPDDRGAAQPARDHSQRWWRQQSSRNRIAVTGFASLALLGILYPAFTNYLFAGDQRVMVVSMQQGAGQEARERLKEACGGLPNVRVITDRGNPDPRIQGRFPVRFDIAATSAREQAALEGCINDNSDIGVLGLFVEGDGR